MTETNVPETTAEHLAGNKWRPSVEPDTYPSLDEIVGQAVGAGSTCWEKLQDAGTFDSSTAKWISEGAVSTIRKFYMEKHLYADPRLPDDVLKRWVSCSRAEAIRQCEENHAALIKAHESIDNLHGQIRALRAEIAHQDVEGDCDPVPYPPSDGETGHDDPWQGARDDDKLNLIRALLQSTTAFGSDMARLKRQLELIVNA